ncbi:uncharacterized protein EV422DRAFT_543607 [Fimicolochytrium jonesii]|uniref:uncharacterized protein n=1 Tax=Fimicolochytrium jonesii TaxID=1396493 RepID=UPI0022FEE3D8|nr:uncharacterized protein EV422DRAFT_543607 [Fimicolochytrium jonesii]KAI8816922.1 hypothetical protein EV422DRAFT_543607 [Fimicolochytrium jonesii]
MDTDSESELSSVGSSKLEPSDDESDHGFISRGQKSPASSAPAASAPSSPLASSPIVPAMTDVADSPASPAVSLPPHPGRCTVEVVIPSRVPARRKVLPRKNAHSAPNTPTFPAQFTKPRSTPPEIPPSHSISPKPKRIGISPLTQPRQDSAGLEDSDGEASSVSSYKPESDDEESDDDASEENGSLYESSGEDGSGEFLPKKRVSTHTWHEEDWYRERRADPDWTLDDAERKGDRSEDVSLGTYTSDVEIRKDSPEDSGSDGEDAAGDDELFHAALKDVGLGEDTLKDAVVHDDGSENGDPVDLTEVVGEAQNALKDTGPHQLRSEHAEPAELIEDVEFDEGRKGAIGINVGECKSAPARNLRKRRGYYTPLPIRRWVPASSDESDQGVEAGTPVAAKGRPDEERDSTLDLDIGVLEDDNMDFTASTVGTDTLAFSFEDVDGDGMDNDEDPTVSASCPDKGFNQHKLEGHELEVKSTRTGPNSLASSFDESDEDGFNVEDEPSPPATAMEINCSTVDSSEGLSDRLNGEERALPPPPSSEKAAGPSLEGQEPDLMNLTSGPDDLASSPKRPSSKKNFNDNACETGAGTSLAAAITFTSKNATTRRLDKHELEVIASMYARDKAGLLAAFPSIDDAAAIAAAKASVSGYASGRASNLRETRIRKKHAQTIGQQLTDEEFARFRAYARLEPHQRYLKAKENVLEALQELREASLTEHASGFFFVASHPMQKDVVMSSTNDERNGWAFAASCQTEALVPSTIRASFLPSDTQAVDAIVDFQHSLIGKEKWEDAVQQVEKAPVAPHPMIRNRWAHGEGKTALAKSLRERLILETGRKSRRTPWLTIGTLDYPFVAVGWPPHILYGKTFSKAATKEELISMTLYWDNLHFKRKDETALDELFAPEHPEDPLKGTPLYQFRKKVNERQREAMRARNRPASSTSTTAGTITPQDVVAAAAAAISSAVAAAAELNGKGKKSKGVLNPSSHTNEIHFADNEDKRATPPASDQEALAVDPSGDEYVPMDLDIVTDAEIPLNPGFVAAPMNDGAEASRDPSADVSMSVGVCTVTDASASIPMEFIAAFNEPDAVDTDFRGDFECGSTPLAPWNTVYGQAAGSSDARQTHKVPGTLRPMPVRKPARPSPPKLTRTPVRSCAPPPVHIQSPNDTVDTDGGHLVPSPPAAVKARMRSILEAACVPEIYPTQIALPTPTHAPTAAGMDLPSPMLIGSPSPAPTIRMPTPSNGESERRIYPSTMSASDAMRKAWKREYRAAREGYLQAMTMFNLYPQVHLGHNATRALERDMQQLRSSNAVVKGLYDVDALSTSIQHARIFAQAVVMRASTLREMATARLAIAPAVGSRKRKGSATAGESFADAEDESANKKQRASPSPEPVPFGSLQRYDRPDMWKAFGNARRLPTRVQEFEPIQEPGALTLRWRSNLEIIPTPKWSPFGFPSLRSSQKRELDSLVDGKYGAWTTEEKAKYNALNWHEDDPQQTVDRDDLYSVINPDRMCAVQGINYYMRRLEFHYRQQEGLGYQFWYGPPAVGDQISPAKGPGDYVSGKARLPDPAVDRFAIFLMMHNANHYIAYWVDLHTGDQFFYDPLWLAHSGAGNDTQWRTKNRWQCQGRANWLASVVPNLPRLSVLRLLTAPSQKGTDVVNCGVYCCAIMDWVTRGIVGQLLLPLHFSEKRILQVRHSIAWTAIRGNPPHLALEHENPPESLDPNVRADATPQDEMQAAHPAEQFLPMAHTVDEAVVPPRDEIRATSVAASAEQLMSQPLMSTTQAPVTSSGEQPTVITQPPISMAQIEAAPEGTPAEQLPVMAQPPMSMVQIAAAVAAPAEWALMTLPTMSMAQSVDEAVDGDGQAVDKAVDGDAQSINEKNVVDGNTRTRQPRIRNRKSKKKRLRDKAFKEAQEREQTISNAAPTPSRKPKSVRTAPKAALLTTHSSPTRPSLPARNDSSPRRLFETKQRRVSISRKSEPEWTVSTAAPGPSRPRLDDTPHLREGTISQRSGLERIEWTTAHGPSHRESYDAPWHRDTPISQRSRPERTERMTESGPSLRQIDNAPQHRETPILERPEPQRTRWTAPGAGRHRFDNAPHRRTVSFYEKPRQARTDWKQAPVRRWPGPDPPAPVHFAARVTTVPEEMEWRDSTFH